jgi:long-subunit fatty acid transport protein
VRASNASATRARRAGNPPGKTMARVSCLITLAVLLLTSSSALAGGFSFPGNGTKSAARAGAYMLSVTGPEALQFNPALLSGLDGFQVTLNLNLHLLQAEFDRAGNAPYDDTIEYGPVDNEQFLFPAPMLFVSTDLGLDDFALAAGVFGPNAVGAKRWPADGPQRFLLVESEVLEIYYSLAAGYNIEGLRFGATFQFVHLLSKFTSVTAGLLTNEDPKEDISTTLELTDLQPTGKIGVAYDLSRSLSVGVVYKLPVNFKSEGTVKASFHPEGTASLAGAELQDDSATFKVSEADALYLSTRYAHLDGDQEIFDLELMVTYEGWNRLNDFEISSPGPVTIFGADIPLNDNIIPHQWKDTYGVRLGGDFNVAESLTLRAGGFFETAASDEAYSNIDFLAHERIGLGAGATVYAGPFDIDLGYLAVFYSDRETTDGDVRLLTPLGKNTGNNTVVNNGTYSAFNNVFTVGFTYRYDGERNAYTPRVPE